MAKNKQQKKKERERRVAQKKHAAAQKRDQDQTASENSKADRKTNIFTAAVAVPKTNSLSTKTKQPLQLSPHRRLRNPWHSFVCCAVHSELRAVSVRAKARDQRRALWLTRRGAAGMPVWPARVLVASLSDLARSSWNLPQEFP